MTEHTANGTNGGKEGRPHRQESWNGVKFFKGSSIREIPDLMTKARGITADHLRENKEVWRPEETVEAAVPFFNEGKVMVVGPPQSGKGTILFGLSEMCDMMGIGYMFFNGHHQEVPGTELAFQFKRANDLGYPIFLDSYDYLFLGSRSRGRAIPAAQQLERDDAVVQALSEVDVPVALTFHDKEHSDTFMSRDLIDRYAWFHDRFPKFAIPLYLQSPASVLRFLGDHDIPEPVAQFLIGLNGNGDFARAVNELQPVGMDLNQLIAAVNTYPVLKELVRGEQGNLMLVMERILQGPEETRRDALAQLAVLLEKTEIKRLGLTQERLMKKLRARSGGNR